MADNGENIRDGDIFLEGEVMGKEAGTTGETAKGKEDGVVGRRTIVLYGGGVAYTTGLLKYPDVSIPLRGEEGEGRRWECGRCPAVDFFSIPRSEGKDVTALLRIIAAHVFGSLIPEEEEGSSTSKVALCQEEINGVFFFVSSSSGSGEKLTESCFFSSTPPRFGEHFALFSPLVLSFSSTSRNSSSIFFSSEDTRIPWWAFFPDEADTLSSSLIRSSKVVVASSAHDVDPGTVLQWLFVGLLLWLSLSGGG